MTQSAFEVKESPEERKVDVFEAQGPIPCAPIRTKNSPLFKGEFLVFGVFVQLRSNLLYQKRLTLNSAAQSARRFYHNSARAAPRALRAPHKTEKFSIPLRNGGWGARKSKNEKIFLFCYFYLRKSAEADWYLFVVVANESTMNLWYNGYG